MACISDSLAFFRFLETWSVCNLTHLCRMYFPILINLTSPFPSLGLLGGISNFYSKFKRNFCLQTVENLIRRRVLRRLIWFCTVYRCPTKRTLGLYWLNSRGTLKKGFVLLFNDTHFVKVNFNPVETVGMVHIAVYHAVPPVCERISSQVASARLPYEFSNKFAAQKGQQLMK